MKRQLFLNTYIDNVTMDEALQVIFKCVKNQKKSYVVPINVDVVVKIEEDEYLKNIVNEAGLILADGKPLLWISKIFGRPLKEKISGSDLVPGLCKLAAKQGYSIFILGGKEGVAQKATENIKIKYPGIQIAGVYSPQYGFEKNRDELQRVNSIISSAKPDILIVCLGCPKQEKFIYENYQNYDAIVSICAGATVDFMAGSKKRAPKWVSECGLEWLYRFFQEPSRLFKRYFVDDLKIIKLAWKYR